MISINKSYLSQFYLPTRAKRFPFGPIIALVLCVVVILSEGIAYLNADTIDWNGLIASYIVLPLFFRLWYGYKKKHKTKVVKLEEVYLSQCLESHGENKAS